ncbi:ammonium transporter [Sulfurospirillum arcachonense]|uniref:ammonium transporter n=1 Tax=Sulfurospirillum arcachonense TaxID=57666 RepID=UPI00046A3733|nr:ammonium transporter [Sulfurospirillum arcachonense]
MNELNNIDFLWIIISAFLVFMMQFGFALIETGMVRVKNTINVAMKNLIDTIFGLIFFWLIGYGLMFGNDFHNLIGIDSFAIDGKNLTQNGLFFFQAMFAATAATIISGAVAERIKFNAYIIVTIVVTAIIYPIFGHWAWAENGWLHQLGFMDFAGSTVVHSMGGWIGLAGAIVLGPRLGKFRKYSINYFAPSNHNFIVFGVFVLFFAWFGFNAGSLLKFDPFVTSILLNTTISGAFGGFCGWLLSLINKEKVSVEVFAFGVIAGLVGITAGCNQFDAHTSAFVGFVSTLVMYYFDYILLHKFKIDDPVSVVGVHGFAGAWGTLAVGFFAELPQGISRLELIYIQGTGVIVAFIFAFSLGLILFLTLHKFNLLRVRKKHEVLGLNVSEHNAKLPWVDTIESIIKIMKSGDLKDKIHEERGTEIGLVAKFFNYLLDVLKQKQVDLQNSNKTLRSKANIDPLTQILNRRGLMEKLKGKNIYNYSIVIIDIDHFKKVNDTYGHSTGDSVLKELSLIAKRLVRENDMFARWGGEEFILLINANDLSHVEKIAEKIRLEIASNTFSVVGSITASFGISSPRSKNQTFNEVFENADKALYQAKELGRNRVFSW